ncbi:class I SAM-dependent methyltransferase [Helicobacter winghamensis]|uniref:class I SAM-dependent methyltransferase n=1 Tax=Helicobacter winghamensis TaxID=157268 RepID=UPI00279E4C7E
MLEKGFSEMLDFALGQMQCTKQDKILDFGCGNGRFVKAMQEKGLNAYGCDIAPKFRGDLFLERQGVDESTNKIFYYHLGEKLPFDDATFQSVFSYQVFEHIRDLESSAKELARVTRNGGIVYSEFAASYPYKDCHTGLPFIYLMQKSHFSTLNKIYCALVVKLGYVKREDIAKMWRFSRKYLFFRSYASMDSVFRKNGFKVLDITYKRRLARLLLDGVRNLKDLYNYKRRKEGRKEGRKEVAR